MTSRAHASLAGPPADLVDGRWIPLEPARGEASIVSRNPAHPDRVVWSGKPRPDHLGHAIAAARTALPAWSRWPIERRAAVLMRFRDLCAADAERMSRLIADEVGKPLWDARQEAAALVAKVDITLDGSPIGPAQRVRGFEVPIAPTRVGRCWFRPHGVMAVLGPFNFPAHLPNGHIVPALAAGNTVVLKPSDKTPAVGQRLAELLAEALAAEDAPPGVVNLVQGGADIAAALVGHDGIDGILFTGSWAVGRRILQANLDRPGRIVALEMGGNNAAIVMPDADLRLAAVECVRSAFITAGQRCTCTRRVIVHEAIADRFIPALCKAASNLVIGDPLAEHPVFMGPVISEAARRAVLDFAAGAARAGADSLVDASAVDHPGGGWYVSPGILRVEGFSRSDEPDAGPGRDVEVFGPLLRVAVVPNFEDAMAQAHATRFGLAASVFTRDEHVIDRFLAEARAGCVNVNAGTAGASSKLPFGGLGLSGNHRPAGAFSLDYCAYPVAGLVESGSDAPLPPGMRFDDAWL